MQAIYRFRSPEIRELIATKHKLRERLLSGTLTANEADTVRANLRMIRERLREIVEKDPQNAP